MHITGCEIFIVTLPLRRAHVWAGNTRRRIGHHAIVRVDTDDGISGWGEAPAIPTWGGSQLRYGGERSEEHTSELQSLMRLSYAVFCSKQKHSRHTAHSIPYYT